MGPGLRAPAAALSIATGALALVGLAGWLRRPESIDGLWIIMCPLVHTAHLRRRSIVASQLVGDKEPQG